MIKRMSLVCRGEDSAEVTDQSEPFYMLLAPHLTLKRNYSVYLKAAASALASANLILFYSCHDAETAPSFSILGTPHPPVTASSVIVPVLYPIQSTQTSRMEVDVRNPVTTISRPSLAFASTGDKYSLHKTVSPNIDYHR
jgi:hypothetical protein